MALNTDNDMDLDPSIRLEGASGTNGDEDTAGLIRRMTGNTIASNNDNGTSENDREPGDDDEEEDEEDADIADNEHAVSTLKSTDGINHRVSLTDHNKLELLRIFIVLRPLYLDPTVSKSYFWRRVNDDISQVLEMPFKSSVYTVKRLVKRRRAQLEHRKLNPSSVFRNAPVDEYVDMVIAIFDEEKSRKRKSLDSRKAVQTEKETMRKSLLASKLAEENSVPNTPTSASTTVNLEAFTNFLNNAGGSSRNKTLSESPGIGSTHLLQNNTLNASGSVPPAPSLLEIVDSINHLHTALNDKHIDSRYDALTREVKTLREMTFEEFRKINSKLDVIYSRLS